jgi:hypothetical protein
MAEKEESAVRPHEQKYFLSQTVNDQATTYSRLSCSAFK